MVTEEFSPYNALMIGALLTIPMQEITRRVSTALQQQVFQWCKPEGSRLTELAARAGMTKQSMGEIIDVLEQRGYVERVPDPTDRRAALIRRTERGWQVNRVARQVVEEVQREWAKALGEEAFGELLQHLRHLALLLDEPLGASERAAPNPSAKQKRYKAKEHRA